MPFLKGGRHLWPHFSQSFSDKNEEFLCSSERKFPEFCKTHPTFVSRPLLVASMARQTLSSVFFGTPCIYLQMNVWIFPWWLYIFPVPGLLMSEEWDIRALVTRVIMRWQCDNYETTGVRGGTLVTPRHTHTWGSTTQIWVTSQCVHKLSLNMWCERNHHKTH